MAVEDFLEENDKPDLFEDDAKSYFHFPCSSCVHRHGSQLLCIDCRHFCD